MNNCRVRRRTRKTHPVVVVDDDENLLSHRVAARQRPPDFPKSDRLGEVREPMMKLLALPHNELDADHAAEHISRLTAREIVEWSADCFGDGLVLSTSFGIQSAVMLHLATSVRPELPVVWVDTGYLPEETYRFADELSRRLDLNLRVYQSPMSPARMEAVHGRLWEADDVSDLDRYDEIRKVEPLNRAFEELGATAWLSGLRREQTAFRAGLSHLTTQRGRHKVLPILDWSDKDVYEYLRRHDLPYHPLFDAGYVTVGDWHSSRPLSADDRHDRDTRFGGRKQECGIHLPNGETSRLEAVAA